jgi:hypothetical protein
MKQIIEQKADSGFQSKGIAKPHVTSSCFVEKKFWISIRRAKNCLFSRRNGYKGKLIFGWSVCIRLFGRNYW